MSNAHAYIFPQIFLIIFYAKGTWEKLWRDKCRDNFTNRAKSIFEIRSLLASSRDWNSCQDDLSLNDAHCIQVLIIKKIGHKYLKRMSWSLWCLSIKIRSEEKNVCESSMQWKTFCNKLVLKTALVKIFVLNFYPNVNLTYIIPV